MGKAARWFRSLLGGGRKDQDRRGGSPAPTTPAPAADRKRWSFARSSRDSAEAAAEAAATEGSVRGAAGGNAAIARAAEAAWLKSLYDDKGRREQSKHAIAVAAATAAAADAAVAAAQAAVEVVRLTSQGPVFGAGAGAALALDPRGRAAAAIKIQTAFRGFLAKKALRALKALVKLQALVRGYLVRRQAAATLQSMQALARAQATVLAARGGRALPLPSLPPLHHHPPAVRPRFSLQERYYGDDTRSEHGVAAYSSRRLSASIETASYGGGGGYDRSPKIVEMDTARPRSSRSSSLRTEDEWSYAQSVSSPLQPPSCQHQHQHLLPPRIAVPTSRHFPDYDWEKPRPATAQCTPRFAPPTPAKSFCGNGGGYYGHQYHLAAPAGSPNCPGYMSSTQSSEAKSSSRSQSAPKQRPPEHQQPQQPARKRVPLSEVVLEARASLGGAAGVGAMHKPCNTRAAAQAQDAFDFRAAVVSRFEQRASDAAAVAAAAERDRGDVFFLQRRW